MLATIALPAIPLIASIVIVAISIFTIVASYEESGFFAFLAVAICATIAAGVFFCAFGICTMCGG